MQGAACSSSGQGEASLCRGVSDPYCPTPQVLELQAPGKRVMAARDFLNGMKGRTLVWQPVAQPVAA